MPAAEVGDPEEVAEYFRNLSGTASVALHPSQSQKALRRVLFIPPQRQTEKRTESNVIS